MGTHAGAEHRHTDERRVSGADTTMTTIGWLISTSGYGEDERARRLAQIARHVPSDIKVEILTAGEAPEFLDGGKQFTSAVAASTGMVGGIDAGAYPVVVLAGAIDPGLAELRRLTDAVVIGCAESSLFLARQMGRRTAIVTVDEHAVAYAGKMVEGLPWSPVVAIRGIGVPVRQIMADGIEGEGFDRARAGIMREAARAVEEDGADAIYLGAMTLGTLGIARELRERLDVVVLNPMSIALSAATQAVRALADSAPA